MAQKGGSEFDDSESNFGDENQLTRDADESVTAEQSAEELDVQEIKDADDAPVATEDKPISLTSKSLRRGPSESKDPNAIDTLRSRFGFEDQSNPTYTGAQLALVLKQTKLINKSTQLIGARYLFSFWESFLLGLTGEMTNGSIQDSANPEASYDYRAYGLVTGWTLFPRELVNLSLTLGMGVGRQTLVGAPIPTEPANERWEKIEYFSPGVGIEVHLTQYVLLGFSYTQRMAKPQSKPEGSSFGFKAADISGGEIGFSINIVENFRAGTSIQ